MTQHQLAEAVDMPQPSIARIERGTVLPRAETLIALLTATGHRLSVEPIGPAVDHEAIKRHLAMSVPRRVRRAMPEAGRVPVLRRLRRFGVPFVLIGELAEIAHGSPIKVGRAAIEVCHASTDVAAERLALAQEDLGRESKADARHLRLLTKTDAGDDYDTLLRNAVDMHVDSGILVQVAALEDLIRIRLARHTPKDEEAAAVLLAIEEARSAIGRLR
jgi:transcriptional regulator with XRE-family HTH domain